MLVRVRLRIWLDFLFGLAGLRRMAIAYTDMMTGKRGVVLSGRSSSLIMTYIGTANIELMIEMGIWLDEVA